MKKMILLFGLGTVLFLSSCTIHKRIDRKGFGLEWKTAKQNIKKYNLDLVVANDNINENRIFISKYNKVSLIENADSPHDEQPLLDMDNTIDAYTSGATFKNEQKLDDFDADNSLNSKILLTDATIINESQTITDKENETNDEVKISGFAIASLVCGILALFSTLIGSIILATLAVVFGLIAINKISKNPIKFKGKGMALAGYIIGLVAVLTWTFIL